MAVYVDPSRPTIPTKRWPYTRACHLYADTLAELDRFARALGLLPQWFQRRQDFPHYDLTTATRRRAVAAGAVEVDRAHAVEFARQGRRRRLHGPSIDEDEQAANELYEAILDAYRAKAPKRA